MSNRRHCADYTEVAARLPNPQPKIDHKRQLALHAPLIAFIVAGYLAIFMGWI